MALTQRQQVILNTVAEQHIRSGCPVSSKSVAMSVALKMSSSTVRNEFALLEEQGLLTHPHTSAGRVPTSQGYREFVDWLLRTRTALEAAPAVPLPGLAQEVDEALRQTSEAMSQATNLLSLVVAPQLSGARVRHTELLLLQTNLVMVVFILSNGRVVKRIVDFPQVVDAGMVEWGRIYLNEVIGDRILTDRLLRQTLGNLELAPRERAFLEALRPAFAKLLDEPSSEALYVGGAARLLAESKAADFEELGELMRLLEERLLLLGLLRSALHSGKVVVSIGGENQVAGLRRFSMVAAGYGLPQRRLGAVSLLGPLRMDYETAIVTVRQAAQLLSDFVEDRYE